MNLEEFGILSFGISVTTMEEVFLKLVKCQVFGYFNHLKDVFLIY